MTTLRNVGTKKINHTHHPHSPWWKPRFFSTGWLEKESIGRHEKNPTAFTISEERLLNKKSTVRAVFGDVVSMRHRSVSRDFFLGGGGGLRWDFVASARPRVLHYSTRRMNWRLRPTPTSHLPHQKKKLALG